MAITATAALVDVATVEPPRPAKHAGWDNPYGDPDWIKDIDWYRRYHLRLLGSAGEVGSIVNWELYDSTIPFKTNAELAGTTAGAITAGTTPFGAIVNNSDTWTVWVFTGLIGAGQVKYRNTGQVPLVTLRANGPSVQVLLGPAKKVGDPATTWTIAAFLPGAGKIPTKTLTQTVQNVAAYAQPTSATVAGTATISTPGGTTTLTATVAPAGAAQRVVWTSSNDVVASVASSGALTGIVTAAKNGTVVITAVAPGNPVVKSTGTTITVTGQPA
jgi:Bacterial Ig-like domain (group 2)